MSGESEAVKFVRENIGELVWSLPCPDCDGDIEVRADPSKTGPFPCPECGSEKWFIDWDEPEDRDYQGGTVDTAKEQILSPRPWIAVVILVAGTILVPVFDGSMWSFFAGAFTYLIAASVMDDE